MGLPVSRKHLIGTQNHNRFSRQSSVDSIWFSQARLLASMVSACLNLVVIVSLNKVLPLITHVDLFSSFQVYEYVAIWLVNLEQPRTQSDFEKSVTFKMFFFQFVSFARCSTNDVEGGDT